MVFPLDDLCIVCQPPSILKKNENGLHCEDGPALSYGGQNEIYSLNGVTMTKELVLAKPEDLGGQKILAETNVEIRRELLRKVGIGKLLSSLPRAMIDKKDDYELYSVDLSDTLRGAKFLKMFNPSIKTFHVEGVDVKVKTVSKALLWRNSGMFENAEVLS